MRRIRILFAASLTALAAAAPRASRPQDPVPDRDPAPELVARLQDPARGARAAHDLIALGPRALPALRVGLADPAARPAVLAVLGRMGKDAAGECRALIGRVDAWPPEHAVVAMRTLGDLLPFADLSGREVFETLGAAVRAVESEGSETDRRELRFRFKRAMERRRGQDADGIGTWTRQLDAADGFARELACDVLGQMGPEAVDAVPALLEALGGEHPDVTYWPVSSQLGEAVPYTSVVRDRAARALVRIAGSDPRVAPAHVRRLRAADAEIRRRSAMALGALGPSAPHAAVAPLVAALADQAAEVRWEAATALGALGADVAGAGPGAAAVRRALEAATASDDGQLAARAEAALRQLR